PVAREMLEPTAVDAIMGPPLQQLMQDRGLAKRLFDPAGPMVLDQSVNDERLAIDALSIVSRFPGQIGLPIITAVFAIEEMLLQESIPVFRRLEVVALSLAVAFPVHQGKGPDQPRLRDQLLFLGLAVASPVVREHVATVRPVQGGVVPVGQN